jgi:hypothetical protein
VFEVVGCGCQRTARAPGRVGSIYLFFLFKINRRARARALSHSSTVPSVANKLNLSFLCFCLFSSLLIISLLHGFFTSGGVGRVRVRSQDTGHAQPSADSLRGGEGAGCQCSGKQARPAWLIR